MCKPILARKDFRHKQDGPTAMSGMLYDDGEEESKDAKAQRLNEEVHYKPIPTDDPKDRPRTQSEEELEATGTNSCGAKLLDDMRFQNSMGLVIVINGIVIGMETDMTSWGHWTEVENTFLAIFLFEVLLKMSVEGRRFFNWEHDDFFWNMFDSLIVGLGVFDVVSTFIGSGGSGGFATVFRMVRLLRILRIFRLLKFLKRLFLLAMGLIEACKAVFWVTILMAFVLYMCAIVLVKTVGRLPSSDHHYMFLNDRFGSVVESMLTLFVLMSSPNMLTYQDETGLLEEKPLLTVFLIGFITFGSFGMIAMLTGVINQAMFENNNLRKEEERLEHEVQRSYLGDKGIELFEQLCADEKVTDGEVPIEKVRSLAPKMVRLLEVCGARVDHGDMHKLIDFTDVDDSGTIDIEEFVYALEKCAEGLTPLAMMEVHHAVGACTRKLLKVEGHIEKSVKQTQEMLDSIQKQESTALRTETVMSEHIGVMGNAMQDLTARLDSGLSKQLADIMKSLQNVERWTEKSENRYRQTELVVSEQVGSIGNSMQKLLDRMDDTDTRVHLAVLQGMAEHCKSTSEGTQHAGGAPDLLQEQLELAISQQVGEMGKSVQKLSDQMDSSETRVQLVVSQEVGEIKLSLQRLLDERAGSGGAFRQEMPASQPDGATQMISQQVTDMSKAVQSLSQLQMIPQQVTDISKAVQSLSQQLERTETCMQKDEIKSVLQGLSDQRDCSSALSGQIGEMNLSLQTLSDRTGTSDESRFHLVISDVQRAAQKLLDIKECELESRFQLALSQQIEEIGMSVQMLLRQREDNNQDGLPYTGAAVSHQLQESSGRSPLFDPHVQAAEEIRKSLQCLMQKEDANEVRILGLQRAVDATQKSLLGGVAELGGVVMGGVADLFAKNVQSMPSEFTQRLLQDLSASHESTVRSLLAEQPLRPIARLNDNAPT